MVGVGRPVKQSLEKVHLLALVLVHMMMSSKVPFIFHDEHEIVEAGTYLPLKHRFTRKAAWAYRVKT